MDEESRMKLNHLGITVTDVYEARAFLETYFGLKGIGKNNHKMTHVQDDNGLVLSLFKVGLFGGSTITEPESTHIGFVQEAEEQVNALYQRLKADGFDVPAPQRSHGWTFTFVAPGGFAVEVVC
jgi:catechol 2,3-dioxygenase-like lactoylglutathione lyase family enzyme